MGIERENREHLLGVRAHLRAVTKLGEVLVDEDVNRVNIDTWLRWEIWEAGHKNQADRHEVRMEDLDEIALTPCSDRLDPLKRDSHGSVESE